MLPNLKVLFCGVVFGLLLFAVTGAGVMLPDSNTRVGEVPQIGRPMMQQMIADEPAQAQFHIMMVARRSEELERLRERAAFEVESAPTQSESDLAKSAVIDNPTSDEVLVTDVAAPASRPSGAVGGGSATEAAPPSGAAEVASATNSGSVQVSLKESGAEVAPAEAAPTLPSLVQVAALLPASADGDASERAPNLLTVPLPPLRPTGRTSAVHRRILHRVHRVVEAPPDTFGQSLFARPLLPPR
jgi:hypothetical protein